MDKRYILIVNGSPRKSGNSALLADHLAAGARAAGAEVESFALHNMDIRPCDACEACHETSPGICIIRDDMQALYPRLQRADAIVIASPIYWFSVNAQTKLFIDRCYALEAPQGNALAGKQFVVILVYGDTDALASGAINAVRMFQDMCRYLKADLTAIIHGSALQAGAINEQSELLDQARRVGRQLAGGM